MMQFRSKRKNLMGIQRKYPHISLRNNKTRKKSAFFIKIEEYFAFLR